MLELLRGPLGVAIIGLIGAIIGVTFQRIISLKQLDIARLQLEMQRGQAFLNVYGVEEQRWSLMFLNDMVAFLSGSYKVLFIDRKEEEVRDWTHKANIYFIKMKIIVKQYEYEETIIQHMTKIMHEIEKLNRDYNFEQIDKAQMALSISVIENLTAIMIAEQRNFIRHSAKLEASPRASVLRNSRQVNRKEPH